MRYLDLTLPTPAENLALDEALLEEAENAAKPLETLRFWEPPQNMAIVGHRRTSMPKCIKMSAGNWASPSCAASAAGRQSSPGRAA